MRSFLSMSSCVALCLGVVACSGKPSPVPRGYVSYDETYKSAPGPEARDVGYDYSEEKNRTTLEDMRYAARDLVDQLDQKIAFNVDQIHLKMPANTAFYNGFDYVLRNEMTQRGYLLANAPGDNLALEFVALPAHPSCLEGGAPGDYNMMYLALALEVINDNPSDYVGGIYEVPTYDYRKAGRVQIEAPECKVDAALVPAMPLK